MTANAKPSWMPSEEALSAAFANGSFEAMEALISRAALDRAVVALEDAAGDFCAGCRDRVGLVVMSRGREMHVHGFANATLCSAPMKLRARLAALRAEREALP